MSAPLDRLESWDPTTIAATTWSLSRGEREGEQCRARGVPPWTAVLREIVHVTESDARAESPRRNCRFSHRLQPVVVGRRSVPPNWWRHCLRGRQQQYPGVSDHAKWPLGLLSLRPRTWSLTPRLKGVGARVRAISAPQLLREFRPACGPRSVPRSLAHSRRDSQTACTSVLRANAPQIPPETRCASRRSFSAEIGHHTIRIELCSASSRLSLRSTLRAAALTAPPRSSKVALM
jgi:hypothetical protein